MRQKSNYEGYGEKLGFYSISSRKLLKGFTERGFSDMTYF